MSQKAKLLFVISVALNVLLLGLAVGHWMKPKHQGPGFMHQALKTLSQELPAEKAEMLRQEMAALKTMRETRKQHWRTGKDAMMAIMAAPEFDAVAFRREVERMRNTRNGMMQAFQEVMERIAGQLSQAERERLVALLKESRKHRRHSR